MSGKATRELESHATALKSYFSSLDDVQLAYLFGSYARGQAGPLADVDVAVLLDDALGGDRCFEMRLEIIGSLMDILRTHQVDAIILNQAPLALGYRVLRESILLYCRDRQVMIEFTARTVRSYLDFKPVIERHERAILDRARKGELLHGYNPHRGALERYRQLRERLEGTAAPDV